MLFPIAALTEKIEGSERSPRLDSYGSRPIVELLRIENFHFLAREGSVAVLKETLSLRIISDLEHRRKVMAQRENTKSYTWTRFMQRKEFSHSRIATEAVGEFEKGD